MSTTAAAFTVLAIVLGGPAIWCHGYRTRGRVDTARRAAVLAERAARPPGPHAAAIADEIALARQALAEPCCLRWRDTFGAEHDTDPDRCTRKDQTT